MSKLLRRCRQFPSFRRRSLSALNPPRPTPLAPFLSPRFSLYASLSQPQPHLNFYPHGNLLIRSFNSSVEKEKEPKSSETKTDEDYPSGEYEFKEVGGWKKFVVKLRTLIAFPWERIPNGSVLTMKLRGQVCLLSIFSLLIAATAMLL